MQTLCFKTIKLGEIMRSILKQCAFALCLLVFIVVHGESYGTFSSSIFTIDEDSHLHTRIEVDHVRDDQSFKIVITDIRECDIPFLVEHFQDREVMRHFGEGRPRAAEATEQRIKAAWMPRFASGKPHGGMLITINGEKAGYIVAGGGDGSGVSETAYSLDPKWWGQGIGCQVLNAIVNIWAPEVIRIGLGDELDVEFDGAIIDCFKCFGGEVLYRIDATASPDNPGSVKILDKNGFVAAILDVGEVIDYSGESYTDLLIIILKQKITEGELVPGQRYKLIDCDGVERTFSYSERFNKIKYHFELYLVNN
jgi:RimJ/RimL family protein N-acetyltransferase